jgi:hypothetical protein
MDGNEHCDPLLGRQAEVGAGHDHEAEPPPEVVAAMQAMNLREVAAAGFLHWAVSTSLSDNINPAAFKLFRDKLLQDAGNPTDPIEVMLIEQLALAHFHIGRLQVRSCGAASPQLQVAYSDAATRLLGEFRRCTLALEDLRAKQDARRERKAAAISARKKASAERNGAPRPSKNGKNGAPSTRVRTNGEIPQCLKDRMTGPIPSGPQLTAATGRNGKA